MRAVRKCVQFVAAEKTHIPHSRGAVPPRQGGTRRDSDCEQRGKQYPAGFINLCLLGLGQFVGVWDMFKDREGGNPCRSASEKTRQPSAA